MAPSSGGASSPTAQPTSRGRCPDRQSRRPENRRDLKTDVYTVPPWTGGSVTPPAYLLYSIATKNLYEKKGKTAVS